MATALIIGAGFSLNANGDMAPEDRAFCKGYPLVGDLSVSCFDSSYDLSAGVEAAFQEARRRRDHSPIEKLVELIESADHYAGNVVARSPASPYRALIDRFADATFLSFNYDGLLELLLHQLRLWTPVDGFGIPCRADIDSAYVAAQRPPETSRHQVLHLHGSVYLYPLEIEFYEPAGRPSSTKWFRLTSTEEVQFDPDALTHSFIPFRGGAQGRLTYSLPSERIIIPSPDKATELRDRFVQSVYSKATTILKGADRCVAIGYRFAACDSASFLPLLRAVDRGKAESLLLVAPDASEIAARIRPFMTRKPLMPFDGTFSDWVAADFP